GFVKCAVAYREASRPTSLRSQAAISLSWRFHMRGRSLLVVVSAAVFAVACISAVPGAAAGIQDRWPPTTHTSTSAMGCERRLTGPHAHGAARNDHGLRLHRGE